MSALEQVRDDNEFVILNPRHIDCDCGLSWDEHERQNDARIAAAEKAERAGGPRIIRIPPARTFD